MDDIIAVKVRDSRGAHFFLTWGRIFDRVDFAEVEAVVAKHASKFGVRNLKSVSVCGSLKEAAEATYFYESLFHISQEKIAFGAATYGRWRAKKKRQMESGLQLFYCGAPKKSA